MKSFLLHVRMIVAVFCTIVFLGCAEHKEESPVSEIKQAAVRALKDLQWTEDAIVIESIEKHGDRWHVSAHRLPPTPGAHATVLLSESGKLIKVLRGK